MMALGIAISIRNRNWGCPDLRFYHMRAIKLFPVCGIAYIPVVGMRMSWTGHESLRRAIICIADQQSLFDFLESVFFPLRT